MLEKGYLSPYVVFNGNCAEAMAFYQSVLGGKLEMSKFGDTPMPGLPEDYKDKIMHASLQNDSLSFMACDSMPGTPAQMGSNIHMSIAGTGTEALTGYFDKLAEGGKVDMALAPQFWGDTFGMLTDKFGIHWMFNISGPKAQ